MKRTFLLIIFGISIILNSSGIQPKDTISTTPSFMGKNFFGINAGSTTGVGFSYSYLPQRNGFQITFLPLFDKNHKYVSLGVTYIREINTIRSSKFIFFASNHLTNFFIEDDRIIDNIGIGPGIIHYENGVAVKFMVGYGIYDIKGDTKTRPTIEFGVFYNFDGRNKRIN